MSDPFLATDRLWWSDGRGRRYVTLIAKATFQLEHEKTAKLVQPQALNQNIEVAARRLWEASDYVPYKPQADLVVVGKVRAPGGRRAQRMLAGVELSRGRDILISKKLVVKCSKI